MESQTKHGVNDFSRMVVSFHALVARCLTHGVIDERFIVETELHMKEFLSAVHEFDIRVRNEQLRSKQNPQPGGKTQKDQTAEKPQQQKKPKREKKWEAWWLKPNYMSLPICCG